MVVIWCIAFSMKANSKNPLHGKSIFASLTSIEARQLEWRQDKPKLIQKGTQSGSFSLSVELIIDTLGIS